MACTPAATQVFADDLSPTCGPQERRLSVVRRERHWAIRISPDAAPDGLPGVNVVTVPEAAAPELRYDGAAIIQGLSRLADVENATGSRSQNYVATVRC